MKIKHLAATGAALLLGGALIVNPTRYIAVCYDGIVMWAESVVPSLFPFMIVTALLTAAGFTEKLSSPLAKLSKKVKLPPAALPLFIMSCLSGYPAGSRCVAEHCKNCPSSADDAKKLGVMCSTSGPLFIVGTVGVKAYGDSRSGYVLLAACLGTVAITSVIYCLFSRTSPQKAPSIGRHNRASALSDIYFGGVSAVLTAGSFIVFFYTLSAVLSDLKLFALPELTLAPMLGRECSAALCAGCIEATGGCFALARAGGFFALPLTGFLITFGGASIVLQQMCYLEKCGVKYSFFILFKLAQGAICFAVLCAVQLIFAI